ncbi:metal ABC transporter solute-binding protein, Zn/Mn family [Phascolarctobacterium sp.]|uniref:metal ABC transporter solute-binding protein, Zn/Mn family n=1 Tax=Phascolarctobacterium sp. TaxID=2049039 RepID=UPI0026DACE30|nr:zinc ABC transporter substrate-binding protein [Phascolarctobacterium sp.]
MKVFIFLLLLLVNMLAGCSQTQRPASDKLPVAASFYPMAEFVRAVGGDQVEVITMVPDGAEPHDWEPSPRDLTRLGRAKVFVYNGLVEPWAQQALEALSERGIMPVEAGAGLFNRDGVQDPHVWISPRRAMVEVERITAALCAADPEQAALYQRNSKAYLARLQALDARLTQLGRTAPKKAFVTAHAAFGHLAADYGLRQLSVTGISPEAEPTPADLQRLIKTVRQAGVRYIFFETLTDPKIAELVAKEAGVQTAALDPLEGVDEEGRQAGLDYLKIMERNADNLAKALNE